MKKILNVVSNLFTITLKKGRVSLLSLAGLSLLSMSLTAQTYYTVTNTSGTATYGGVNVTVANGGIVATAPVCTPEMIFTEGNNLAGSLGFGYFSWYFSTPVTAIRFHIVAINPGDNVHIIINTSSYCISYADISPYAGDCYETETPLVSGCQLVPTTDGVGGATIDINPGYGINSVSITCDGTGFGVAEDMLFTAPPPCAVVASCTGTPVTGCYGNSNGTITVSATGGTSPYSEVGTYTGLTAGPYLFLVTDANGCEALTSISLTQPPQLLGSATATPASCYGGNTGTATVTASGGTPPYLGAATYTGLSAGTLHFLVTDAHGCRDSETVVVTQPAALGITGSKTNATCFGYSNGSITTTATGGTAPYSYLWAAGGSTASSLTGLTPGSYTVTVNDAHGCGPVSHTYNITQPATLNLSSTVTNVYCFGNSTGKVVTTVTGGTSPYTYNWSNSTSAVNAITLAGGVYSVMITDANGCSTSGSYAVTTPAIPISISSTVSNVLCHGGSTGSITTTVTGTASTYTYHWNGGATTSGRTELTTGSYTVTVTDPLGCTASGVATVAQPNALSLAGTSTTNVSCHGGSNGAITTSVSGGTTAYSYNWGGGVTSPNRSSLTAGVYSVTVTDANSCTINGSYTVSAPESSVSASIAAHTNVSCFEGANGTINIAASGGVPGYTYAWSNGDNTANVTGLAAASYSVTVADAHLCTTTVSQAVTSPAALSTGITATGSSPVHLTAGVSGGTAPFTYDWTSSGGGSFSPVSAISVSPASTTSYTVMVTDDHGCIATGAYTITVGGPARMANTGINPTIPEGPGAINVYPNPTDGTFGVEIPATNKEASILVTDLTGRVIVTREITENTGATTQFSLTNLAPGIYLVKVSTGNTNNVVKLIVR